MMLAYNNDPQFRRAFIAQIKLHRAQDQIISGTYGKENGIWRGCAVGCSIHSLNALRGTYYDTSEHAISETIGIPQSLYHLQDAIFEGLPQENRAAFVEDFATSIRAGADLSRVTAQFLVWCLLDKKHGTIRHAPSETFGDCHRAILGAAALWQGYIKTGKISAWRAAARAAARSAESAARAAASAAWSAAARSAARSAESAASAESATAHDFWRATSVTLCKLLRKAPMGVAQRKGKR